MMSKVPEYDWEDLKNQYILGETMSVSEFIKGLQAGSKGAPNWRNHTTKQNTKGWRAEKQVFKKSITDAVINETVKTRAGLIAEGKQAGLEIIVGQLTTARKRQRLSKDDVTIGVLRGLWEMLRIESGENIGDSKIAITPPSKTADELTKSIMQKYKNQWSHESGA